MQLKKYCLLFLFLMPAIGEADNAYDFGDYIVYYNAFTANTLPPTMATAYGILRSKYKGVLNLSVQKKQNPGQLPQPVNASVSINAKNLAGQLKTLEPRRVTEGKAIYYLSEFALSNKEMVTFNISIKPDGVVKPFTFSFKRQFYID
ncbi:MAG: hypothetical protein CL866_03080 [Cycloclasticus sp.]|nr:hypothetical protein [Cycloclasticus sp.]MBG95839.1 hypothetical protein [Cycloclasticus sp.]HAI96638.1 DUF4426 domain-containing protein [Methylococcaceae bacterium]|tara:strand:- start:1462 stop:1902 length:441 start_codon:yes stop_codon:yes gene_type:complete